MRNFAIYTATIHTALIAFYNKNIDKLSLYYKYKQNIQE